MIISTSKITIYFYACVRKDRRKDFTVKVDAKIPKRFRGKKVFYRFRAEGAYSQIGTTFTLPKDVEKFKIAVFSCSNYPAGYFNAYDSASNDESIDLAVHLGDYLYEYKQGEYATDNAIRLNRQPIPNKEIVSLSDHAMLEPLPQAPDANRPENPKRPGEPARVLELEKIHCLRGPCLEPDRRRSPRLEWRRRPRLARSRP